MPSIQLGALKSYVEAAVPDVRADTLHYYLTLEEVVGLDRSQAISQHGAMLGDAIFAYHLFPEKRPDILSYIERERHNLPPALETCDFEKEVIIPIGEATRHIARRVDWSKYLLIGFSLVFSQTLASLYMAKLIKDTQLGRALIVAGGPGCTGHLGISILQKFPQFDLVVNGEGELPLSQLVGQIRQGEDKAFDQIPGIISRSSDEHKVGKANELKNLSALPLPNYEQYFKCVEDSTNRANILTNVAIPIETSRGCWWDLSHRNPMFSCSFCSLNVQWKGYREKSIDQFISELSNLTERHGVKNFLLVDNILRRKGVTEICDKIGSLNKGFKWAIEARVSVKPKELLQLARAGVYYIQFGIEALSTDILRVIRKGTTCIQNIQAMKFCVRFGILNLSNLITQHPGVSEESIRETIENISFLTCYPPLNRSRFSLDYGSPISKNPEHFGVLRIRNDDSLRYILPEEYCRSLVWPSKSFDLDYTVDRSHLWIKVEESLSDWRKLYDACSAKYGLSCLLLHEQKDDGMRVTDFRFSPPKVIDLDSIDRDLYLICEEVRTLQTISQACQNLTTDEIHARLEKLVAHKLIFRERTCYLSLGIPANPFERRQLQNASDAPNCCEALTNK